MNNSFVNLQSKEERKAPQILYAGNSISSSYLSDLVEYVADKDFSVNVISKSGTTTEPAIAFRVFEELLVKNMAVKKQINVSMQQQIKKKVPLKLMLMQTTGILLLCRIQLADVFQF